MNITDLRIRTHELYEENQSLRNTIKRKDLELEAKEGLLNELALNLKKAEEEDENTSYENLCTGEVLTVPDPNPKIRVIEDLREDKKQIADKLRWEKEEVAKLQGLLKTTKEVLSIERCNSVALSEQLGQYERKLDELRSQLAEKNNRDIKEGNGYIKEIRKSLLVALDLLGGCPQSLTKYPTANLAAEVVHQIRHSPENKELKRYKKLAESRAKQLEEVRARADKNFDRKEYYRLALKRSLGSRDEEVEKLKAQLSKTRNNVIDFKRTLKKTIQDTMVVE